MTDSVLSPTLTRESRSSPRNWTSSLPAHNSSEESLGGCLKFCPIMSLKAGRHCLSTLNARLSDIRKLLTQNAPGKIEASQAEVLHIYVEASFDYSGYSGLGGLIVNMSKDRLSFFSTEVDRRSLDDFMAEGHRTVIQELEMMAVLVAVSVWRKLIKSCRVVLFTDSEAVRGAFVKSWSANEDSDKIINIIFQVEEEFDLPVWIERVPNQSNPSGVLSREIVTKFGEAETVEVDPWEMWCLLTEVA